MKISLRPADSKTKTGDYLIKNQQCPVIFCDFSQKFQKSRLRQNDSHIGSHRLHDDRSDLFSLRLKELLHRIRLVVLRHQRIFRIIRRHALAVRYRLCERSRSGFYQKSVRMSVIASSELHDLIPSRKSSRHTDGAHRRLRSGTYQSGHFHRRDTGTDQLCKL